MVSDRTTLRIFSMIVLNESLGIPNELSIKVKELYCVYLCVYKLRRVYSKLKWNDDDYYNIIYVHEVRSRYIEDMLQI